MTRNSFRRLAVTILALTGLLAGLPAASAAETSQFFGFENSLQGWTRDHQIDCEQDPTPCTFDWSINRSTNQAKSGTTSLRFRLDGTNDDGTIWVERQFDVGVNTEATVEISFWVWSETQADINTWPVVAYIGKRNPEKETDFQIIGQTERKAGWAYYSYSRTINGGASGKVWVAFGIGATWESERVYFLDSAKVTITT